MKKITLLLFLLTAYLSYAQPTSNSAAPTQGASEVLSVFNSSSTYTDTANNYNPNWGQNGFASADSNYTNGGQLTNAILAYPNWNYQGIQITPDGQPGVNVADMEFIHVDLWTNDATTVRLVPIQPGVAEFGVNLTIVSGSWSSVDIPLSSFTGYSFTEIIQFKFDMGSGSQSIYLDNIYFWKNPADPAKDATLSDLQVDGATIAGFSGAITDYIYTVPSGTVTVPQITTATTTQGGASRVITQASAIPGDATVVVTSSDSSTMETYTISIIEEGPATAAPTPPARAASSVKSIFSDAYTDPQSVVAMNTYDTGWCPGTTTDVMIAGNATKKVTGLGCEGIEFVTGRFDPTALGLTHFHVDVFTESTTMDKSLNLKISNWDNGAGENNAIEFSLTNASSPSLPNPNPGTWISYDIPLTDWTPGLKNDFVQFIITSDLGTIWYDNMYFHSNTVLSNEEFSKTAFRAYPNPTQDSWTLRGESQIESIRVIDILGKEVISLSPNSSEATINGSDLKSGIYFAQIKTLLGVDSVKLVKQ